MFSPIDSSIEIENEVVIFLSGRTPNIKADKVINHLKAINKKIVFVSNKTTGTAKDYFHLLKNWGLNVEENEILNSTIVASNYLKQNFNGETCNW